MQITASASTPETLFDQAAHEFLAYFIAPDQVGETLREKIALEASTVPDLFNQWVAALLALVVQQKIILHSSRCRITESAAGSRLTADIVGELRDPLRHEWKNFPETHRIAKVEVSQAAPGLQAVIFLEKI